MDPHAAAPLLALIAELYSSVEVLKRENDALKAQISQSHTEN